MTPMENPYTSAEVKNWLELPSDLMLTILMKVTPYDILQSAQFVCIEWYTLCQEPDLWRSIHIRKIDEPDMENKYEKMMFDAIGRSAGGLIDLSIEGFGSDELCSYVALQLSSSQLKRLRLAKCDGISKRALVKALAKLSSLEELELTLCNFRNRGAVSVINSCPGLTTFKFNNLGSKGRYLKSDKEALAIAASMPQLRNLQLIGNNLTNVGLTAIMDACPRLESLDLRGCYHLNLEGDLGKDVIRTDYGVTTSV